MTYLLHVIAREVPANDADVFELLEQIAGHTVSMVASQQLKSFRDALLKLFPCLSSYGAADDGIDNCPWADGPLGDNFKGGYGSVAIARRHDEVIPAFLRIASDLGLTVVDEQEGAVHRPLTYQVVLEGPLLGVDVDAAAAQLADLMNQSLEQMVALLHSRRRTLVKRGLLRTQADIYVTALRERASCQASVVPDVRKAAAPSAAKAGTPSANPSMHADQPAHGGIEADDDMFTVAEAQRKAAMAAVGGVVLLALAAVRVKTPFVMPALAAMGLLGAMAVFQLGQAMGAGFFRKLLFALLALVPGLGIPMLGWTYVRAAGVLKNNEITSGNAMPGAAVVRELGGLEAKAMLPSTKTLLVLLVLAAVVAAVLMPNGR